MTSIDQEDLHDLIAETRLEKEWLEQKEKDVRVLKVFTMSLYVAPGGVT